MGQSLSPTFTIDGFDVRPGLFEMPGAVALDGAISFTIHSYSAASCTLLLFHDGSAAPS